MGDIMQVGNDVEKDLIEGDVRLTMGGEPTFVSIDDFEGAEWNTAADGPLKRKLAYDLALRLKQRFAHGGFIHFGQGKWYPGELFPRCMHYTGERRFAIMEKRRFNRRRKYKIHFHDAEKFATELTKYLGIDTKT
jgi:hypothetical protein